MVIHYIFILLTLGLAISHHAFAGGFDKPNLISGKYTALGSAASSSVNGPESLLFNPAGLAQTEALSITANAALGLPVTSAPLGDGSKQDNKLQPVPLLGLFGASPVAPRLGVGAGFYVSGGAGNNFGNVSFGPRYPALQPELNSTTAIFEASLGAGYEILDGLRLGASWRVLMVQLNSKTAGTLDLNNDGISDVLLAPELSSLSDTVLNAFRFGLQFAPKDAGWGLGATFRTAAPFSAKGQSGGFSQSAGSTSIAQIQGGNITVAAEFPRLWSLGGHYDLKPELRLFLEYTYINSAKVRTLTASGDAIQVAGVGSIPAANLSAAANWRNQHTARVGLQYNARENLALRAGYVFATQVVPNENASPYLLPPGNENVFTVGAGTTLNLLGAPTIVDLAFELEKVSGTSDNPVAPTLRGDYDYWAPGLFAGFTRRF